SRARAWSTQYRSLSPFGAPGWPSPSGPGRPRPRSPRPSPPPRRSPPRRPRSGKPAFHSSRVTTPSPSLSMALASSSVGRWLLAPGRAPAPAPAVVGAQPASPVLAGPGGAPRGAAPGVVGAQPAAGRAAAGALFPARQGVGAMVVVAAPPLLGARQAEPA